MFPHGGVSPKTTHEEMVRWGEGEGGEGGERNHQRGDSFREKKKKEAPRKSKK
jgi:hypothetical protein